MKECYLCQIRDTHAHELCAAGGALVFCLAGVAGVAVPTASSAAVAAACPSPLIAPRPLAIGPTAACTAAAAAAPPVVAAVPTPAVAAFTVAPTIAAAAVVAPSIAAAGVGGPVVVVAIAAPPRAVPALGLLDHRRSLRHFG